LISIILTIAIQDGYSKILIIGEYSLYHYIQTQLDQYINDITIFDNKKVEYVGYPGTSGTNIAQCMDLRSNIEASYQSGIMNNDKLEGVVLIGNLPVPQYVVTSSSGGISYWPFDYYYMDVWDSRSTGSLYPTQGIPQPFSEDPDNAGYFACTYSNGDSKFDIWVSRIYGPQLAMDGHLRSSVPGGNPNTVLDEYGIYGEYLDRLHKRYTEPATVPYRGFAMGGTLDGYNLTGLRMDSLRLPMYVEFNSSNVINTGEGSGFNWMSQLQAGPKGNTNYGAYNGTIFPNERNARNCQYTQLKDARTFAPYNGKTYSNLDNNGWEWAGVFGHSSPCGTAFLGQSDGPSFNSGFSSGTLGPFWGKTSTTYSNVPIGYVPTDGSNASGYYYYYNCNNIPTDPFNYGIWRGKSAEFRYIIPSDGTYAIYLNYSDLAGDLSGNCTDGELYLYEVPINSSTHQITGPCLNQYSYSMGYPSCYWLFNMGVHYHRDGSTNWEQVFDNITLHSGNMAIVVIPSNGQNGDVIADAIRFKSSSRDDKIDNAAPLINPVGAGGGAIFSTQGFSTSDYTGRSYLSMQDEDGTNHNKFSKTPFYITNACEINDFIYINGSMDNLGNLYALGHNGLICMGTSNSIWESDDYYSFTCALTSGNDFGQAFLLHAQAYFAISPSVDMYALLGAGSIRAQPYVQYGSEKEENKTVSTTVTKNSTNPVLIRGVTVSSSGNYTVTSTVTTSPPAQCSHSEVVVRGETVFTQGCTSDIKAN